MRTVIPPRARLIPENAKRVFEGIIFDVYHWPQKLFDGTTATFEMLKRPDTVTILAIKDDKLVIVEEEQPAEQPFIGIPCGRHDHEGETEVQAAQRELLEETGLSFKTWKLIGVNQPADKIERFFYYFLATDFNSEIPPHLDPGERINVKLMSFEEAKALIGKPRTDDMALNMLQKVSSLEELLALPEYRP